MTTHNKTMELYMAGNKNAAYVLFTIDPTAHTCLSFDAFCEAFDKMVQRRAENTVKNKSYYRA